MPKYLTVFEKGESVRWLSHLDILRTFERAIRRAELPIAFSAGFNPRERLSFVSALGTGITGSAELAHIELTDSVDPNTICTSLNKVFPGGIRILHSRELTDDEVKNFAKGMDRAEFLVVCGCPIETQASDIEHGINALLAREEATIEREREGHTRTVDVRPLVHTLTLAPQTDDDGIRAHLYMTLGQGEGAVARPLEIVNLLQTSLPGLAIRRVHRIRILDKEGQPWLYDAPALVS
ncbi:MAG: TIGR03936 family radical SAM-associated protein [Armatimonadetes bacterium]|nr:TIGR03936 family radical SAM-associated protein [Armatimonadota bacterium]